MAMEKRLPRGVIIAFEGIDGAGKTTQAHLLVERLRTAGWSAIYTKEPTDGPWGQKIRSSAEHGRMPLEEELAAFLEDRREHVANLLGPALGTGQIVVLDRYYFSTAAYQGARGADWAEIIATNESFAPEPDLLVFLDIPVETGMERIRTRGYAVNLFEKADALERSAKIFRSLSKPYLLVLDGQRSIEDLSARIFEVVEGGILGATR